MRQMRRMIFAAAGSLLIGVPLASAQTQAPAAPPAPQASVSSAQASKAGHALKQIMAIEKQYQGQMKNQASPERQNAQRQQAVNSEVKAIHQQGLSVAQYSEAVTAARTDPKVRQELLAAANLGQK